jgi:hypothetical protein
MWTAQAPVLALLGDIGKVSQEKYLSFIEAQSKIFKQVLVLFGNHECEPATSSSCFIIFNRFSIFKAHICRYYHSESYDTLIAETREKFKHLTNVTLMQKTVIEIDGVILLGRLCVMCFFFLFFSADHMNLGTTLWSNVPAEDAGAVSRALNDYLFVLGSSQVARFGFPYHFSSSSTLE